MTDVSKTTYGNALDCENLTLNAFHADYSIDDDSRDCETWICAEADHDLDLETRTDDDNSDLDFSHDDGFGSDSKT